MAGRARYWTLSYGSSQRGFSSFRRSPASIAAKAQMNTSVYRKLKIAWTQRLGSAMFFVILNCDEACSLKALRKRSSGPATTYRMVKVLTNVFVVKSARKLARQSKAVILAQSISGRFSSLRWTFAATNNFVASNALSTICTHYHQELQRAQFPLLYSGQLP